MSEVDTLDLLQRALDQNGTLIAGISPEQHSAPTPCEDWDVKTLVEHLIGGLDNMTASARGEQPDWSKPQPPVEGDWAGVYRAKSAELLDAWREAGREKRSGWGMPIAEHAVHGWDLAVATGQPVSALDPSVAEKALDWTQTNLKPEYRGTVGGGSFGEEVPVSQDAPIYDRLAAWCGRDPSRWRTG